MTNALTIPEVTFSVAVMNPLNAACVAVEQLHEIVDTPTCEAAVAANTALGKAMKALTAEREKWTKPLVAAQKAAIAAEKAACAQANEYAEALATAIREYHAKLQEDRIRAEAEARLREEALAVAEGKGGEEHVTPPLVASVIVDDAPKIPMRKVERVVIHDLAQIPREFFDLNETRLKAALKERPVPGAQLAYEEVLVRR